MLREGVRRELHLCSNLETLTWQARKSMENKKSRRDTNLQQQPGKKCSVAFGVAGSYNLTRDGNIMRMYGT